MKNKKLQALLQCYADDADVNISISSQYLDIDDIEGDPIAAIDLDQNTVTTWEETWIEEEVTQPQITSVNNGIVTYVGTGEDNIMLPNPLNAEVGERKKIKTGHYETQAIIIKVEA